MPAAAHTLRRQRLRHQRLTDASSKATPAEVVRWMGAMQAQDYAGAKWAVGLRAPGLVATDVDQAFADGAILRTHVLRPTWHFVTREDIGWIVSLSAPRVHQLNAFSYRQSGLDPAVLTRTRRVLERELDNGAFRTRLELADAFARAGMPATGERLGHILIHAELERVICSGPRRGKQFTYALLDARAPRRRALGREEALAELTRRYFQSHGPATVRDFVWWSGLTSRHVATGIEVLGRELTSQRIDDRVFWMPANTAAPSNGTLPAFLLPNYDEYFIAYKDRDLAAPASASTDGTRGSVFAHQAVVDGQLVGSWSRDLSGKQARIHLQLSHAVPGAGTAALQAAAASYGAFLGMPVDLTLERVKRPRRDRAGL